MPSTYSSLLRLELIGTGEQAGTWGTTTNTNLGTLLDQAIAGTATINVTSGNVTLTSNNGASDQARCQILRVTGTPGVSRNIVTPATSKAYVVRNGSNAAVVIKTASSTGVTIAAGATAYVMYDTTSADFIFAVADPGAVVTLTGTQTLTNKTLTAPVISTISNTGTLTLPTSTDTLVGRATTDTLTNKTLTAPVISTISNTGTLTLPTSTDTLVGRATTDTLTNKSISGATNTLSAIPNAALTNSSITVNGSAISLGGSATITAVNPNALTIGTGLSGTSYNGSSAVTIAIDSTVATLTGTQTLTNKTLTAPVISTISNTGTLTLPTSTDTLVGRATTDTLTNKTLTAPVISTISNTGTLTLPTSTDTLVGRATTDTLTNKTLTSPRIGTSVLDTNGNTLVTIAPTASAVNNVSVANAAAGGTPVIEAVGSDTNIALNLRSKGTSSVLINGQPAVSSTSTQTLSNKTLANSTTYNGGTVASDLTVNNNVTVTFKSSAGVATDVYMYRWTDNNFYLDNLTSDTIFRRTGSTESMRLTADGYLLVGYSTSNGGYKLQVNSQIFATNSVIATSDARYKKDVENIDNALGVVMALRPVSFRWKEHPVHEFNTEKTNIGFLAQEVQTALAGTPYSDSLVHQNECEVDGKKEPFLGLAEGSLIALLTRAVQELKSEVDTLKAQLNK